LNQIAPEALTTNEQRYEQFNMS